MVSRWKENRLAGVPIDFRFLDLLLRLAKDPEVGIGEYAAQIARSLQAEEKCRLASQTDPLDYLEQTVDPGVTWRRNYASLEEFEDKVMEVVHGSEARGKYRDWFVVSPGTQRKDKPGGQVTARVLFDGTRGLCVNSRTRLRDQERQR